MAHEFQALARFYHDDFAARAADLPRTSTASNLVRAFRKRRDAGNLEIITCGATHGFLPLMDAVPEAVRAQIQVAVQHYRAPSARPARASGCPSAPTCPGTTASSRKPGIRFFILDAHGLDGRAPAADARRATRPSCRRAASPSSDATASRRGRSGAPRSATRATRTTASSTGTSAATLSDEALGDVHPRRAAQEHRHQVLPRHRQGGARRQAAVRPRVGRRRSAADHAGNFLQRAASSSWRATRTASDRPPLVVEPVRRRALRPLVVRGAGLPRLPLPQAALRPGRGPRDHAVRLPRAPPRARGRAAAHVHVGRRGLRRGLAQPGQRLDLPPPPRRRGAHGRAGAPLRVARPTSSAARSTRPRASCCSRSPPTGPSS